VLLLVGVTVPLGVCVFDGVTVPEIVPERDGVAVPEIVLVVVTVGVPDTDDVREGVIVCDGVDVALAEPD